MGVNFAPRAAASDRMPTRTRRIVETARAAYISFRTRIGSPFAPWDMRRMRTAYEAAYPVKVRIPDKKKKHWSTCPNSLAVSGRAGRKTRTLLQLYEAWEPTHRAGESTMDCYRAAIKYFKALWHEKLSDITVDDLQECMDDCPRGKRTRENMKALIGLLYKYDPTQSRITEPWYIPYRRGRRKRKQDGSS